MTHALRYILLGCLIATVLHYWLQPSIGVLLFVFLVGNALGMATMAVHFAVDNYLEKA